MKATILALFIIIVAIGGYLIFFNTPTDTVDQKQTDQKEDTTMNDSQTVPDSAIVNIETSEGNIEVTLDGKAAPQTVGNFLKLTREGFYEGLKFHRIVDGFMIQGGDPKGDGTGGPGYTIPAEIGLKHTNGAIAMARLGDQVNPNRESSGSQFYITLGAQTFLDGQYTVFGYVTSGFDVVDRIGKTPVEPNPFSGETSVPLKDVIINKVTLKE
ncbi:MAG: peptidylprolyl isomerase [bacterium]|nr:peptidylprolyl isomerase [bacterium]